MVAATNNGIWVSNNAGSTFVRQLTANNCSDLAMTVLGGAEVWLGACGVPTAQATAYRSTDTLTWSPVLSEAGMTRINVALRGNRAYAMGATRLQVALHVVVPAAFSGLAAAYILGISRAVGETMIVAVAAGMQPNFTFNPTDQAATITAYIVQVAKGDLPHGSTGYLTIFAAGLTLFVLTLVFNLLGFWLRRRFREEY